MSDEEFAGKLPVGWTPSPRAFKHSSGYLVQESVNGQWAVFEPDATISVTRYPSLRAAVEAVERRL